MDDVTATVWLAWFTAALALATFVLAVVSWLSLKEAQRARHEQSRPMVLPSIELRRRQLYCLVVRNYGSGVATNVRIDVSPDLLKALQGDRYARVIHMERVTLTLAPGQEKLYVIGTPATIQITDLPASTFKVQYMDLGGRSYEESVAIDFYGLGPSLVYSTDREESIQPVVERLAKLDETLGQIERGVKALASHSATATGQPGPPSPT